MTSADMDENDITLEYDFCEPPQKVWRAISMAEFRKHWLPDADLSSPEATAIIPGEEVCYRLRDNAPPHLESTVRFVIAPNGAGGTRLRIVHQLDDARDQQAIIHAANSNNMQLMRAA
ncbi:SRPBCC family protein [Pseudochrobactrum sp. HB0163]|uniref:SRPBCC family protein n=1 Tax=Pseudochrobactrum sp. HB0163 TaxID=3450708 RepID=UPI003F6DB19D